MSERPRLIAVSPVNTGHPRNGFALRVHHLLNELCREWEVLLLMPDGGETVDLPVAGRLPIPAMWRVTAWHDPVRHPTATVVRQGIEAFRPAGVLCWPGTEWLAFADGFPLAVADRIDCAALISWRQARNPSNFLERALAARDAISHARYERRVVRAMAATIVVGEDDAAALRQVAGVDSVQVVMNGVKVEARDPVGPKADRPTVALSGTLNYPPNVDAALFFVNAIWPKVRSAVPDAEFMLVGRNPTTELTALHGRNGVKVQADVPDMGAALHRAWVAVAPMRTGAGVKNKILESWAVRLPVVMSAVATNGLKTDEPTSSLIADSPEHFAGMVIHLLQNEGDRVRLGTAGRELATRAHSWRQAGDRLTQILRAAFRV